MGHFFFLKHHHHLTPLYDYMWKRSECADLLAAHLNSLRKLDVLPAKGDHH